VKNESNTLKISELRVGNWYESVKFRVPVRCDLSDLYNLCAISDGAYDDPPIDEMFTPILLTEEWLKRGNYEKMPEYDIWVHEDGVWIYGNEQEGFFFDYVIKDRKLEFVHTFQNLHFALTGKELEIK